MTSSTSPSPDAPALSGLTVHGSIHRHPRHRFLRPPTIVSNHDLARLVDTSDEWITTRTGIRERRIAGPHEPSSELAARAGIAAIAVAAAIIFYALKA